MNATILKDVRPWGSSPTDLLIEAGVIVGELTSSHINVVEGAGRIVVPAFADVHCHLDSTRLGLPFRPHTGDPGRWGSIMNDRAHWRSAEKPVAERATYTLGQMISSGTTSVRSHAQVDADSGLEKFLGVLAAREAHRDRASVEVVAFPQVGIHLEKGVVELLDEALSLGADLVGGIDPCEIDRDPVRHLDTVFGLASKHGKGIDIHIHEGGSLGRFSIDLVCERVEALGMQGRVTISHAFALASPGYEPVLEKFAELDISITTVAPGGGLDLPLLDVVGSGVRVGLGMDGQRDYWSPYGNGDMLDRAYQLAFTQGYNDDASIELTLAVASWGGRTVRSSALPRLALGARPGISIGDAADLVLFDAETAVSGVMDRPVGRLVMHRGAVIAEGGELV